MTASTNGAVSSRATVVDSFGNSVRYLGNSPSSSRVVVRRPPASNPTQSFALHAGSQGDRHLVTRGQRLGRAVERARGDERDRGQAGLLGRPGELACRQPVAVGGHQRQLLAVDLDPDSGENRQRVVAAGRDRDLAHGTGEDLARDGSRRGRHGRQRRVVVHRHGQQREAGVAAGHHHLAALGHDLDWPGRQAARNVGEQPARDEDPTRLADVGVDLDPGRDLVVEPGQPQPRRPGRLRLHQDAGEHGHRRSGRQAARRPRDRLGQDVTFDPELHAVPASSALPLSTRPPRGTRSSPPRGVPVMKCVFVL